MKKGLIVLMVLISAIQIVMAQDELLTIAERSEFRSTGKYLDVVSFIDSLQNQYPDCVKISSLGTSTEGYTIPMVTLANPLPANPDEVGDRIVVYIQANIHAGEVEGKEAAQMLMRDILAKKDKRLFDNTVLIFVPILNIDSNDKISTKHRRNQVGPENGVGLRYNGQNLDLNRDAMKLETPEIKAVVENILNVWDPAITVDCHTTNGSFHEEPVTYTWMQNPNGDRELINFMRDEMMPDIKKDLADNRGVENIFYGVFIDRMDYSKGWISYASEPRYLVNYIGLRNRLAILNENYAYADYKSRVLGCYEFLESVIDYSIDNKLKISKLLESADSLSMSKQQAIKTDSFAIEYKANPTPEPITILAFETDTIPGVVGYWRYKQSDRKVTVTVPYFADYYATSSVVFPRNYILDTKDKSIIDHIKEHGIKVQRLKQDTTIIVEEFKINSLKPSKRLNQGHYLNIVDGEYISVEKHFAQGTYIVPTNQKLGRLAAALLEPEARDSMLKWNFFDRYLVPQWGSGYYPYPVYKINFEL